MECFITLLNGFLLFCLFSPKPTVQIPARHMVFRKSKERLPYIFKNKSLKQSNDLDEGKVKVKNALEKSFYQCLKVSEHSKNSSELHQPCHSAIAE